MFLMNLSPLLAEAGTGATQVNPTAQMVQTVGMLAVFGVMFYFILIRPQQKKAKEHAELLKGVKAGDRVVTTSGIIGVVVTLKDKSLSLRSADSKLEVSKSSIAEVLERSGESSES